MRLSSSLALLVFGIAFLSLLTPVMYDGEGYALNWIDLHESPPLWILLASILLVALHDMSLFYGIKFIRAYGTFSHPNVLSMYLITAILFVFQFFEREKQKSLLYFVLFILVSGLILTFSRMAIIGFVLLLFFLFLYSDFLKKNMKRLLIALLSIVLVLSFIFPLKNLFLERFNDIHSINERVELLSVSAKMFVSYPFGIGLSNFTLKMNEFSDEKLFPWEYQPVHNVFMLVLNEIGVIALCIFVLMLAVLVKSINKKYLGFVFAIFVFMLFDHFFFSLYQGQALMFLLLTTGIYSVNPQIKAQ